MKGIVLISYLDYLEHAYDMETTNHVIALSKNKSEGIYISLSTYDDVEMINLINATSETVNKSPEEVEYDFGTFFFDELKREYGHHFEKSNLIEFINHLNNYIHPEIEASMEDANTPTFTIKNTEKGFKLIYTSNRKCTVLPMGYFINVIYFIVTSMN